MGLRNSICNFDSYNIKHWRPAWTMHENPDIQANTDVLCCSCCGNARCHRSTCFDTRGSCYFNYNLASVVCPSQFCRKSFHTQSSDVELLNQMKTKSSENRLIGRFILV